MVLFVSLEIIMLKLVKVFTKYQIHRFIQYVSIGFLVNVISLAIKTPIIDLF